VQKTSSGAVQHRPTLRIPAAFERAFARLEKDLRTSIGG